MGGSFTSIKRASLERRLSDLQEEYTAVSAQIGRTIDEANSLRLKRQASFLEGEINKVEVQLTQLEQVSSVEDEGQQGVANRVAVDVIAYITQHFDQEELRTLCFHLGIDYDDLPAQGRSNKIRELVRLLNRHNRISELIQLGKEFRPNVNWGELGID